MSSPEGDKIWHVSKICDFPRLRRHKDQQTMNSKVLLSSCHFPMATYSPSFLQFPISSEIPNNWNTLEHAHQICVHVEDGDWCLINNVSHCKCFQLQNNLLKEVQILCPSLWPDTYPNYMVVDLVTNLIAPTCFLHCYCDFRYFHVQCLSTQTLKITRTTVITTIYILTLQLNTSSCMSNKYPKHNFLF